MGIIKEKILLSRVVKAEKMKYLVLAFIVTSFCISVYSQGSKILRRYFEKMDSSLNKRTTKIGDDDDHPCCDGELFFKKGIPSVTIGTSCRPGIHTTCDTPDLVNPKILVYNAILTFLVLYDIAMGENDLGTDLK